MKNKLFTLSLVALTICITLSGCQGTPDKDIVVNKNNDILGAISDESSSEKESNNTMTDHHSDEFICTPSGISFVIDAVINPIHSSIPIVRTKPHQIQPEEVKKWAEVLFGDVTVYEPITELSKSEIEEKILMYTQLSNADTLYAQYGNDADVKNMQVYYQQLIDTLEEQYKTSQDQVERKATDWVFRPSKYYFTELDTSEEEMAKNDYLTNTYELEVVNLNDPTGYLPIISATNRDEDDYKVNMLWFYYEDEREMKNLPYSFMEETDALELASYKLSELDLNNWSLATSEKIDDESECSYRFVYTPTFSDVPTLMCSDIDLKAEDTYAANYYYSELDVIIYNGVLQFVTMTSPLDVVETVNENATLLSFSDIYQVFQSQMQNQYSDMSVLENLIGDTDEDAEIVMKVSTIKEGMFRIKEKGQNDTFLMVPAWSFTGELYVDGNDCGEYPLCYINAVDGSIINTQLGY